MPLKGSKYSINKKGKQLPPPPPPHSVVPIAVHPKHPITNSSVANATVCGIVIQPAKETVGRYTEQNTVVFVQKRDCPEWRVKARTKLRMAVQIHVRKIPPPPPHPILFFVLPVEHPKQPNTR